MPKIVKNGLEYTGGDSGGSIPEPPADGELYARTNSGVGSWKKPDVVLSQAEYDALEAADEVDMTLHYYIYDAPPIPMDVLKYMMELNHPVGSIHISSDPTPPDVLFGVGTWERLEGVFIAAASDGDVDFSVGDTVRGTKNETLVVGQIPSHDHSFIGNALPSHTHIENVVGSTTNGVAGTLSSVGINGDIIWRVTMTQATTGISTKEASAGTPSGTIAAAGSNQPHNNMPPYLARYVWERTA